MNIHRLKDALHEMIDACDDKELLDHFLQVLHLEKATNSLGLSMEFKSEFHTTLPEELAELEEIEEFGPFGMGDDPLDYPEFEGGVN
jgi:hypothetical protein